MSPGQPSTGQSFKQAFVNQTPVYDNALRKKKKRSNQVLSKSGMIRPDKRYKAHYI